MHAIAHARPRPAIAENSVGFVQRHYLLVDLGHEFEIVGTEGASYPEFGIRPVTPRPTLGINREPIRVILIHILMRSVRVRPRDGNHAQTAASRKQITEGVGLIYPSTAIMKWNLAGIIGNAPAGAQTRCIRMHAPEIVEPELRVVVPRIVLNQC